MTRPPGIDVAGGTGGGGDVDTVNGIAPIAGDVTLTATDILTTSGDVQGELDALNGSVTLSTVKVESWADFAAVATEAPAGTWTWDFEIVSAGTILMPFGAQVVGGTNSKISGSSTSASTTWIANVDAPAFSGPLSMSKMTIVQTNPGADARCIDLTSDGTRSPLVIEVALVNGRVGLRVGAVFGALKVETVISQDAAVGFEVGPAAVGAIAFVGVNAASAVPGFVGAQVDAGATVNGGILFSSPAWVLTSGQFGFAISHSATFVSPALIQIEGSANIGPQDALFRQTAPGVTDMATTDVRLVVRGSTSSSNWGALGIADRTDAATPLIVSFVVPGVDADALIPYEDGGGVLEIVASTETRFILFKDGGDITNWYWEYPGPIENVSAGLVLEFLHDRAAGTGFALLKWQVNAAPAYAGWVDVPNSESPFENTNSVLSHASAAVATGINAGDRLRPVAQNNADIVSLRLQKLRTQVRIT